MKFRTSFGFQLTCLVIIVLPATLVTAYDFATSLSDKRESSYACLQSIADQCAHDLDGLIRSTFAILKDVSDLIETLNERRGALQPTLARILESHPEYANIRLLDREGLLLASALPAQHPLSHGDRVEVSQAIAGLSAILMEEHGERLGEAACDRGAFTHVFSNLISNAVKYTRSHLCRGSRSGVTRVKGKRFTT